VLIDEAMYGVTSRQLLRQLDREGIQARPLWQPGHLSPAHQPAILATDCSVAEVLNRQALSLPSSVGLSEAHQADVISQLCRASARPRESSLRQAVV
jgi:perosamine synthetase